jgi:hypothetical protein
MFLPLKSFVGCNAVLFVCSLAERRKHVVSELVQVRAPGCLATLIAFALIHAATACGVPYHCEQDPAPAVSVVSLLFPDVGALLTECTHEDGGQRPGAAEARDRVRAAVFAATLRTW